MSLTLSPDDVQAIAKAVAAELRAAPAPIATAPELIGCAEAMRLLSCNSRSAFYRAVKDYGLRRQKCGKYRLHDIKNAVARRSMRAGGAL